MDEWVLLQTPALFLLALLGLLLILFKKRAGKSGRVVSVLAVLVSLAAFFFAVLYGASWTELSVLILAYLAALFA